jgi:hypothetical protein
MQGALALALLGAGFAIGWSMTGVLLPEPSTRAPKEPEVVTAVRPIATPVPLAIESAPPPKEIDKPRRRAPAEPPSHEVATPPSPPPPSKSEAAMRELRASPTRVALFSKAYSAIKEAAEKLPPDRRNAVLGALNAANLTGDVEGLERGLALLREGEADAR